MRKKSHLKKLALLGLIGGMAVTATACETSGSPHDKNVTEQKQLTESDLAAQLSPEGKRIYQNLDPEGKKLALQLANQSCKGKNTCKGLNACKTADNSCAGEGGCKGTSPGPFKDKNDAVKVAASYLAKKRAGALNGK